MRGRHAVWAVTLAFLLAVHVACSIFHGVTASAPCGGVSPAAVRATLAAEDGAAVQDVGDGARALDLWSTRDGIPADVSIAGDPPELRLIVGSYGGMPDGADDDDLRRRTAELTELLSASHPELGPWQIEDHTGPSYWLIGVALLGVLFVLAVLAGSVAFVFWLAAKMRPKTRAAQT